MLMLEGVRKGIDMKGVDLPETPHVISPYGWPCGASTITTPCVVSSCYLHRISPDSLILA